MSDDLSRIGKHFFAMQLQKAVKPHTPISCRPLLLNPAFHASDGGNQWLGLLFGSLNKKQIKWSIKVN